MHESGIMGPSVVSAYEGGHNPWHRGTPRDHHRPEGHLPIPHEGYQEHLPAPAPHEVHHGDIHEPQPMFRGAAPLHSNHDLPHATSHDVHVGRPAPPHADPHGPSTDVSLYNGPPVVPNRPHSGPLHPTPYDPHQELQLDLPYAFGPHGMEITVGSEYDPSYKPSPNELYMEIDHPYHQYDGPAPVHDVPPKFTHGQVQEILSLLVPQSHDNVQKPVGTDWMFNRFGQHGERGDMPIGHSEPSLHGRPDHSARQDYPPVHPDHQEYLTPINDRPHSQQYDPLVHTSSHGEIPPYPVHGEIPPPMHGEVPPYPGHHEERPARHEGPLVVPRPHEYDNVENPISTGKAEIIIKQLFLF